MSEKMRKSVVTLLAGWARDLIGPLRRCGTPVVVLLDNQHGRRADFGARLVVALRGADSRLREVRDFRVRLKSASIRCT